jgi:hypothetical protein
MIFATSHFQSKFLQILHPVRAEKQAASVLHPSTAHGISPSLSSTLSNLKKKSVDFF